MLFLFTLFKVKSKNGLIWHARFWDESLLKSAPLIVLKKGPLPAFDWVFLETAREYAQDTTPNGYVLESPLYPGKPVSNNFFRDGVAKELSAIGITRAQQKERDLTPNSLRHTFVTLAQLAGIADVEIRALAGHKDVAVMQKYSHVPQVIDFDKAREKIEVSIDVWKVQKVSVRKEQNVARG